MARLLWASLRCKEMYFIQNICVEMLDYKTLSVKL